jgi:hypothetical protein
MGKWLCSIAVLALTLSGCGSGDTPTRQNDFTPLTSIAITSTVVTLPAGVSIKLTATGNFSGLFTRDITNQVTWNSAQPGTANFVSLPGYVTALLPGVATITAILAGVTSDDFLLTVNDAAITTLTVAPPQPSLPLGLSQAFTAQGTFSDGTSFDLTKDVTWSSSDITVAAISNDLASKGTSKSEKMGSTTIAAQFGTFPPASTTLTVTPAALSTIEVTPASASLLSLSSKSFSAKGIYSDTSTRDITSEVTWESSAPTVAAVTSASLIKALAPGPSTIKATLGTVSGTSNLKVTGGSLNNIALTLVQANNNVLIKGTRSRITARGTFNNGTSRDITGAVTLAVDSANASVTPVNGNLAWVQAHEVTPPATPAKISASYGSILPGESLLTVTAPTLNTGGLSISELDLTLAIGSSERLSLTGTFSSGNSQNLTPSAEWSFVPASPATVGNVGLEKGRVAALAAGTAEITATYNAQTVTTTVTAVARTLQSLTILPFTSPDPLIPGAEKQFMVEALYADGTRQDVTVDAVLSIDNTNVAKFSDQLSDPGLIVAVDAGSAILTATFGGKEDTETVTVSP